MGVGRTALKNPPAAVPGGGRAVKRAGAGLNPAPHTEMEQVFFVSGMFFPALLSSSRALLFPHRPPTALCAKTC